jgi:O-antigen/teichoic acid export membrane protein
MLRLGYLAGLISSGIAAALMVLLAWLIQYQPSTTWVICLLAVAVPFYSLSMVAEAVIKGREQMHLIALGSLPGNVTLVVGSWLVLWLGFGVLGVVGVVILSRALTFVCLHVMAVVTVRGEPPRVGWRLTAAWALLKRSRVFLWSDSVAAVGASLFAVLLSKFASESEVGMLNAAFQLLQPVQIMYRSVGHSSFPPLVTAAKQGRAAVATLVHSVLSLITRLAFPACLIMFVFAGDILELVYGDRGFKEGAFVLQILSFSLLFDPLSPVLGHALWAVGADRTVFRIVIINVIATLLMGLLVIGTLGLLGAAICGLASSVSNTLLHCVAFGKVVGHANLPREFLKMVPAVVMALAIVLLAPWSAFLTLPLAMLVYTIVVWAGFGSSWNPTSLYNRTS